MGFSMVAVFVVEEDAPDAGVMVNAGTRSNKSLHMRVEAVRERAVGCEEACMVCVCVCVCVNTEMKLQI